jgi:hypothetical protein
MTMATSGKQIEALTGAERERELRLRYAGAVKTLVRSELRAAAARLVAVFPFANRQEFMTLAGDAWTDVVGEVILDAGDSRRVQLAGHEPSARPEPAAGRASRTPRTTRVPKKPGQETL